MPSGVSLPLFLKRKWEKELQQKKQIQKAETPATESGDNQQQNWSDNKDNHNTAYYDETSNKKREPQLRLKLDQELTRDETNELSNRVFTTAELEERIMKTTSAMFDIQRQLHRGEEIYYEDTYSHGSIYKGWDAFVDMKDIGSTSSSGGGVNQTSSNRRVPADSRWFSTSCESVSRTTPPARFPPPLISLESLATAKLATIPEQHQNKQTSATDSKATTITKANPTPGTTAIVKDVVPPPDQPTSSGTKKVKTKAETEIESSPSSSRTSQRGTPSAATTSNSSTKTVEKTDYDGASPTPKLSTRIQSATTKADSGGTRKKRKSTTTTSSEEPPSKRSNQKTSLEEGKGGTKNSGSAAGSSSKPATTVTTRGSKSESNASTMKSDNNQGTSSATDKASSKADGEVQTKRETPTKRQKEVEAPVPRKRGRPRRKS